MTNEEIKKSIISLQQCIEFAIDPLGLDVDPHDYVYAICSYGIDIYDDDILIGTYWIVAGLVELFFVKFGKRKVTEALNKLIIENHEKLSKIDSKVISNLSLNFYKG